MGCDIHLHLEKKINDRWEHFGEIKRVQRDYELFSKMNENCGRGNQEPIAPEKGLPDDINPMTKELLLSNAEHSFSWLSGNEIKKLSEWCDTSVHDWGPSKFPGNLLGLAGEYDDLFSGDYRFVFGFDN